MSQTPSTSLKFEVPGTRKVSNGQMEGLVTQLIAKRKKKLGFPKPLYYSYINHYECQNFLNYFKK
jgi:hypothetical protein